MTPLSSVLDRHHCKAWLTPCRSLQTISAMTLSNKTLSVIAAIVVIMTGWLIWHYPDKSPIHTGTEEWDLSRYTVVFGPISIDGINSNLSGLTYHRPSGRLYAVTNKPEEVHVISREGELLQTVELSGFRDTESIAHVAGNVFVIAEEQRYNLAFVDIDDRTQVIRHSEARIVNLAERDKKNIGIEGVAWSERHGLFATREKPPRILHAPDELALEESDMSALTASRLNVRDFAGLTTLPGEHEMLLVLSESSDSLHVVDLQGRERSRLSLRRDPLGLAGWMRQPEGVAVDDERNIYIVGEPNRFMILGRKN